MEILFEMDESAQHLFGHWKPGIPPNRRCLHSFRNGMTVNQMYEGYDACMPSDIDVDKR
jgi:hypothetical protein